jgi:hypothetical protein
MIVGFMKLFLSHGCQLDPTLSTYLEDVQRQGNEATKNVLLFLSSRGSTVKSSGSVLRVLRVLLRKGDLNCHINAFQINQTQGKIVDPTPKEYIATFEEYSSE